jgi:type IV secretory pathway VirJ component
MSFGRRCVRIATALFVASSVRGSRCEGQSGDLPILTVPSNRPGDTLAVLLSGDGGWAAGDKQMAATLAARGIGVVGLNSRAYLADHKRTPDDAARDIGAVIRKYLEAWHASRVLLIGYSRGADMAPFIVNRLTDDLRQRVSLVAFIGLAERASFEFHWSDLVKTTHRATDLPVRPELERLRGMPMVCLYGRDDKETICPLLDPELSRVVERSEQHHMVSGQEGPEIIEAILSAVPPSQKAR